MLEELGFFVVGGGVGVEVFGGSGFLVVDGLSGVFVVDGLSGVFVVVCCGIDPPPGIVVGILRVVGGYVVQRGPRQVMVKVTSLCRASRRFGRGAAREMAHSDESSTVSVADFMVTVSQSKHSLYIITSVGTINTRSLCTPAAWYILHRCPVAETHLFRHVYVRQASIPSVPLDSRVGRKIVARSRDCYGGEDGTLVAVGVCIIYCRPPSSTNIFGDENRL